MEGMEGHPWESGQQWRWGLCSPRAPMPALGAAQEHRPHSSPQSRPPPGVPSPSFPENPPESASPSRRGAAAPGSPRFVSGGRVRGNACAGRGMSSASWLRSLDPIPGNVTGNSEWAGPAPELGGQRTPGGAGAHGDPAPARTEPPDPAGGCSWGALPASPPHALRAPPLPLPAKFVPWIFPPCRSQLRPARPGAPQNPGASRGAPLAPRRR